MAIGQDIIGGFSAGAGAVTRGFEAGTQAKAVQAKIQQQKQQDYMSQFSANVKAQSQLLAQAKQQLDFQTMKALNAVPQKYKEDQQVQAKQAIEAQYTKNLNQLKQHASDIVKTQYAPIVEAGVHSGFMQPSMLDTATNALLSPLNTLRPDQQDIIQAQATETKTAAEANALNKSYTYVSPDGTQKKAIPVTDTQTINQYQNMGWAPESGGSGRQTSYSMLENQPKYIKDALGELTVLGEHMSIRNIQTYVNAINAIQQENPGISPQDNARAIFASRAHGKAYGLSKAAWSDSGKLGMWATAVKRLTAHIGLLIEAAKGLNPSSLQAVNKVVNAWRNATGDSSVVNFDILKIAVANEYSKMLKGAGTMGEEEVRRNLEPFNNANSLDQLLTAAKNVKHIMAEQVSQTYPGFKAAREGIDKNIPEEFARHFSKDVMDNVNLEKKTETKQAFPNAPSVGTVINGYKYTGGDPSDKNNWEKQ